MPETLGMLRLRRLRSICLALFLLLYRCSLGTRLRIAVLRSALYPEEILDLLPRPAADFLVVAQRETGKGPLTSIRGVVRHAGVAFRGERRHRNTLAVGRR